MGTRTAQGISSDSAGRRKPYKADVNRITLNILSPETRLLVLEALGQTEAGHSHGAKAADAPGRCLEDVKIMVKAFLAESGV